MENMNIQLLKDSSELIVYNNPQVFAYIGKGRLTFFSNRKAHCHWHEDVEILLPIKGYLGYNVNGHQHLLNEKQGIFINGKQMHYGYSVDGSDCEYLCIIFHPGMFFQNSYILKNYVEPLLESGVSELILNSEVSSHQRVLEYVSSIYEIFEKNHHTATLEISSLMLQMWKELFEIVDPLRIENVHGDHNLQILKKMLSFIYEKYDTKISLSEIAEAGDICRSKCCKLFKLYLKSSPNDFLNSYRLEKGFLLLREQEKSISEIAYLCGFSSSSYFSELFLKYKGCTPTEFRNRNKL